MRRSRIRVNPAFRAAGSTENIIRNHPNLFFIYLYNVEYKELQVFIFLFNFNAFLGRLGPPNQCPNLMNLSRVLNPPKSGFSIERRLKS